MSTSVKISDGTKSRLEELQAKIRLKTGRKVTQQELLDHIVTNSYESSDELIESYRDEFEPLTEEEADEWLSGTIHSGVETDEEDIDDVLYGK